MIINIILVIVVIICITILVGYNTLIRKKNRVSNALSNIDVVLNRRFDLIPNLVECVKGYSKHESGTLEDVVKARNEYNGQTHNLEDAQKLNSSLNKILMLAESYPELKANQNYLDLQRKLSLIEDELQIKRTIYNNAVTTYNTSIEVVPINIIAKMFNFKRRELFTLEDNKKENIKVSL